jgi:hypothetical protein
VALFRDLSASDQHAVGQEVIRRENIVSSLMLDVTRRAVTFLFLLLLASGITLLGAGAHYAYHASLFLLALICFLLGLLCVGVLFAINHQTLFGLVIGYAWFKFRVLDSQVDTAVLNSPPPSLPKIQRLAIASGYAAFTLWVLGAVVGVAAFTVGIREYTTNVRLKEPTAVSAAQRREPPQLPPSRASFTLPDEIALGALTVGLAQAIALIWTVWLAGRTAQRQLRAYVVPETYDLLSGAVLNPPQPAYANDPAVELVIKNTGQTPAYKVRTHAQLSVIAANAESSLIVPPMQLEQYSILGPNVSSRIFRRLNRNLTPQEIAGIQTGAMAIYLYGRTEYVDAFKRRRFTTFRMRYSGQWPLTAVSGMNFATEGNDGD